MVSIKSLKNRGDKNKKAFLSKCSFLILSLLFLIFVYIMSAQNGTESNALSEKIVNYIRNFFSIPYISIFKTFFHGYDYNFILRKCTHVTEYTMLYFLLYFLFRANSDRAERTMYITLVACIFFACLDEFHQSFINGRTASIRDVMIDTSGSCLSFILIYVFYFIKNFFKRTSSYRTK